MKPILASLIFTISIWLFCFFVFQNLSCFSAEILKIVEDYQMPQRTYPLMKKVLMPQNKNVCQFGNNFLEFILQEIEQLTRFTLGNMWMNSFCSASITATCMTRFTHQQPAGYFNGLYQTNRLQNARRNSLQSFFEIYKRLVIISKSMLVTLTFYVHHHFKYNFILRNSSFYFFSLYI